MINYITANLPLFTNPDRKLIIKLEEINTLDFEQSNFIINAEVSEALKKLPDNIVQTIITSPPYYDQRDYHTDEQIGNEESPEQYINRLIEVFDQAKRVLKEDGTLWLNL
ncbi:MAG: DNA methyltransferase, partial [Dolichospermum sp.]